MLLLSALLHSPVLLAPTAAPSELDIRRVPADSTWLIHADLEALRKTDLWRVFLEEMGDGGRIEIDGADLAELGEFEEKFGIRPLEDVDAITITGNSKLGDESVIMVETGASLDRAMAQLQQMSGYRSLRRGDIDLHGWADHGDVDAAFYVHEDGARRIVVLAESEDSLPGAIDVLRGKAPNLAQSADRRLFPSWMPGAFLVVDATGVLDDLAGFEPASAVAEMARGVRIEVGESRGELSVTVHIVANTGDNARDIFSVLNGARALASLAGTQEDVPKFAMDLLNALDLEVTGDDVSIQFRYNSRELIQQLEELEDSGR